MSHKLLTRKQFESGEYDKSSYHNHADWASYEAYMSEMSRTKYDRDAGPNSELAEGGPGHTTPVVTDSTPKSIGDASTTDHSYNPGCQNSGSFKPKGGSGAY